MCDTSTSVSSGFQVQKYYKEVLTLKKFLDIILWMAVIACGSLVVFMWAPFVCLIGDTDKVDVEPVVITETVCVPIEVEPQYAYDISSVGRELLARLVYQESNIESLQCQIYVASVVMNRLCYGEWGDTLSDVIYADGQFDVSDMLYRTTPTETNYEAVDYVIKNGSQLPHYVMFFRANKHHTWYNYLPYTEIDHTFFGYSKAHMVLAQTPS